MKRLKYSKNNVNGSESKLNTSKGFESNDGDEKNSNAANGSVDRRSSNYRPDSSHRPKFLGSDAPRKLKILTGNVSSKKIIRSDSQNKSTSGISNLNSQTLASGRMNEVSAVDRESRGDPGSAGLREAVVRKKKIGVSPEAKLKILSSKIIKREEKPLGPSE